MPDTAYLTTEEIQTAIPAPDLVDALDDDRDGAADEGILDAIIASAANAVDAYLAPTFEVPFETPPAPVREAALCFACERIYERRPQLATRNPFKTKSDFWRTRLGSIGRGEIALDSAQPRAFSPGAAITETSIVNGSTR
jgi:phage gp36-like protein